ncbi:GyrI-like domain-containing protein [Aquibium sp. ELW1220]|uniref:GyrI-like domain-containing protein n=1 Tax=Aquibium sp. ELW1220 TaxID=2976766 RepID=UPI0025AF8395|nr:GyrI-like domain-containing protein [Aquibium sp. ELW1220]MDN2579608.1 GyrI-like domain-containing protein [Aquibium sp. ELW1220]
MEKIDFRTRDRLLYTAPAGRFVEVEVPSMTFVQIDGDGDPNTAPAYRRALEWLYSTAYAMKFAAKASLGIDYVVPPLEGLWHADDPAAFVRRRKDQWRWTMMIMVPPFVDGSAFDAAVAKSCGKLGDPPPTLRFQAYAEGRCLQTLHLGSYGDEGPVLARLHDDVMPNSRLTFNGPHHEIYLSDPRRVEPGRLRTILRQPVRPLEPA